MGNAITLQRTVCIKLSVQPTAERALQTTIQQYREAANHVVDTIWLEDEDEPETLTRTEIHHDTYDAVRERTDLHASHVQLARNRAAEAMTAVVERRNQGYAAGRPQFTASFLDFNERCMTVPDDHVSLATIGGRVTADFVVPNSTDAPFHTYFRSADFEVGRSTLTKRDGVFYLHVALEKETTVDDFEPETPGILGLDLGLSNIAVSSTGRFWNGDQITHWRAAFDRRRRALQQCGSRDAHDIIGRASKRLRGRIQQRLHRVSNEIVREADEYDCPVVAVEDLTDVYERLQRWPAMRSWAYRTLVEYVRYKGRCAGISVVEVDPEDTSKRCSTCGYTDSVNRQTQERFECKDCGYQNHADYNAAKNVGLTYLRRSHNGDDGRVPAGVRLNGGIVTQNGYQRFEAET